jgi:alpha-galactosidase/6-phospho-beta-glucosidase family protein
VTKLAYVGGGSLFVPSIVNGIARVLLESSTPFAESSGEVELCLFDILPEKAERMRAYAEIVRKAWDVPLRASVAASRAEALEGADLVMVSVWLAEEHARLNRLVERLGFRLPEEGPGVAGWALAGAPWSLEVAAEMRQHCPDALFVTLMNPTDVIAGLVGEAGGVRAAGLCVEVDGLRGALAYYFRVPYESIELVHAGVNHDGWVLELKVDGQDGYGLWRERWWEIERDPDYHPGNRGIRHIHDLTGHLRSSAYHNWPYEIEQTPEHRARWDARQGRRESCEAALDEALRREEPIADPPGIHPERSKLNYPYTGITVGKLMQSIATGRDNLISLQVPNHGAISNFPEDAIVEVPTRVHGRTIQPISVGEAPEWLAGTTHLLAIQRQLIVKYVLDRRLDTLKQALAVLPMFGTVQQLNRYAEALHEEYSSGG